MKIVIDINEKDFEFIKSVKSIMKNSDTFQRISADLFRAVKDGEPLKNKYMPFNELPNNSVFIWGEGLQFLKLKDAIPDVGMSKQPTNCFDLQKNHYCVMSAKHLCKLVKQPDDFEKSTNIPTETSFLPVGVTATVNPDDIECEWTSICTGTCYGRDTFSAEDVRGGAE